MVCDQFLVGVYGFFRAPGLLQRMRVVLENVQRVRLQLQGFLKERNSFSTALLSDPGGSGIVECIGVVWVESSCPFERGDRFVGLAHFKETGADAVVCFWVVIVNCSGFAV